LSFPVPEREETAPKILVAVAWPYANGPRHIGHVAGYGVPSDVFARYQRLRGADVLMVSGTDDHGTPITYGADKEGISPQQFADRYNRVIIEDQLKLGLAYDCFTRTHTRNHYAVTQDLFARLYAKGYLVIKKQLGAISPSTGRTLPDRFIEGTCPICDYREARGDQCDNCGNQLDPMDLSEPHSRINGEGPDCRETEHFFFDLPAFGERLQEWIGEQQHWRPNVRAFSHNFIAELKPRAITRDLDWGVPIPLDGWRDRDDKRIYVAGHSNGGMMAYRVGVDLADEIAGIGVSAGLLGISFAADKPTARPVTLVAFHGKADTVVPYDGGEGDFNYRRGYMSAPSSVDTFAKRDGCDGATSTSRANGNVVEKDYTGCDGGSAVVFVSVGDLSHKWPGDRHGFGLITDRSDVRATDMMWEIFKAHPKL